MTTIHSTESSTVPTGDPRAENAAPKMDAALKAKWVEALRSGEYKQARGKLSNGRGGYCCLGVLCKIAGLQIIGKNDVEGGRGSIGSLRYRPILDLIGINDPYELSVRNDGGDLSNAGDGSLMMKKHSFPEIADFIESHL